MTIRITRNEAGATPVDHDNLYTAAAAALSAAAEVPDGCIIEDQRTGHIFNLVQVASRYPRTPAYDPNWADMRTNVERAEALVAEIEDAHERAVVNVADMRARFQEPTAPQTEAA